MDIEKKLFFNRRELILNNINKTINMEIEKFKKEEIDWKNIKCEFDDHLSNRKQEYIDTNRIGVYGDKFYMVNEKFEIIDEINIYDIKKVEKLQNEGTFYEIDEVY